MKVQRVARPDGSQSVTVIGADFLPIEPIAQYLRFLDMGESSPHTIRSYAHGLAKWWTFLEHTHTAWDDFPPVRFGEFLAWLRTGDLPGTSRIGPTPSGLSAATVQVRAAAVQSFYRYHAAANQLTGPYQALYSPLARAGRNPYTRFLEGIADRSQPPQPQALFRVRTGSKNRTPVLEPHHVQSILDACTTQDETGAWSGSLSALRNRLLFAVLAETGMRLGEALGLRHSDVHMGRGTQPALDVVPRASHPHGARAKSGHPRRVYIGHDLESLYSAYVWALVDTGADLVLDDLPNHYIFVNAGSSTGEPFAPLRPETVYAAVRSIKRRTRDLPPWTPHWLRHTHATALLLSGCPPHVVMRRLGHRDVQTTLSVYGWVTEDAELRAVADWRDFAHGWKEHLSS